MNVTIELRTEDGDFEVRLERPELRSWHHDNAAIDQMIEEALVRIKRAYRNPKPGDTE